MRFDIITPFPEAFRSYLGVSILKRAIERRLISVRLTNPRDFTRDKHRTLDDKPYGGGAGMVLMAEPILKAVDAALKRRQSKSEYFYDRKYIRRNHLQKAKIIVLSAKGKQFNQKIARDWARSYNRLIVISGRYEGIDERVRRVLKAEEVSVGPYVLTDGDAAAMMIISVVSRLVPGVIRAESLAEESHGDRVLKREDRPVRSGRAGGGMGELEYPHYTRPEVLHWNGRAYRVPTVLLSGDHGKISRWRARHRRESASG